MKRDLIAQIRNVYMSHIKWRSTAQSLHLGIPILDNFVESDPKLTEFGIWYYGDGQFFNYQENFKELEVLNNRIHYIYKNICKIDQSKSEKSFLSLFKDDEQSEKLHQISALYKDLGKQSKELLKILKEIESDINESE